MREIIVLGGYGWLGRLCVDELVRGTRARIVAAGRSIQRAEKAAARHGTRARAAYADTGDARTLQRLLPGSAAIVDCTGTEPLVTLDLALRTRVPYVGLSALALEPRTRRQLEARAWEAQVPVVLNAGAAPGLPGILAELLVRRFAELDEIRIASTGPWLGSETARRGRRQQRETARIARGAWRLRPWRFPGPAGRLRVGPTQSPDLEGFVESHCVERLTYLEPRIGRLAGSLWRMPGRRRVRGFCLVAEAFPPGSGGEPGAWIELEAADPLRTAAAAAAVLLPHVLGARMPGGCFLPREAVNPERFLDDLSKRGIRVRQKTG